MFLKGLRIEFTGYYVHFYELNYKDGTPFPLYPYIMWQWNGDEIQSRPLVSRVLGTLRPAHDRAIFFVHAGRFLRAMRYPPD